MLSDRRVSDPHRPHGILHLLLASAETTAARTGRLQRIVKRCCPLTERRVDGIDQTQQPAMKMASRQELHQQRRPHPST